VNPAQLIMRRVGQVDWGSRPELERLLETVTTGEDEAREEAWGDLWDCVENDGTIDESVLPVVPILIALADWGDYPERVHAMVLLREIASADGIAPAHDHEQFALLREALASGTRHLAARWRSETPQIRRALVWLLSAVPEIRVVYHDLIDATLPDEHRAEWEAELVGRSNGAALESWVYSG
jgi:hypothetical protein